jgi:hypothetical protein
MIRFLAQLLARKLTMRLKKASDIFLILFCFISTNGYSQLVLNEMMSFNGTTLSDQFSEFPDWLELYNSGSETEYLGNYWLSDERVNNKKWQLPSAFGGAGSK